MKFGRTILIFCLLFPACSVYATTYTAASGSRADVQAALNLAVNGDTVVSPGGWYSYTSHIVISNGIKLAATSPWILQDDLPIGLNAFNQNIIFVQSPSNTFTELTGFTITNGTVRASNQTYDHGAIMARGFGAIRVHDTKMFYPFQNCFYFDDMVHGVVDHNTWGLATHNHHVSGNGNKWGGNSYDNGDGSWFFASNYGTTNVMCFENNYFYFLSGIGGNNAVADFFAGARWMWRYNICSNGFLTCHGRESGNADRSPRQFEDYYNTNGLEAGLSSVTPHAQNYRGGSGVNFGNSNYGYKDIGRLSFFLGNHGYTTYWGGSDGQNPFDSNSVTTASFQHTGTNASKGYMVSSGATMTVNQYQGWFISDSNRLTDTATSPNPTIPIYAYGEIWSNTATEIFFQGDKVVGDVNDNPAGPSCTVFCTNGNYYVIRQLIDSNDRCGNGSSSVLQTTAPGVVPKFLFEAKELVWFWGNTLDGSPANGAAVQTLQLVEGREYSNAVKVAYSPLSYPHPLVQAALWPPTFRASGVRLNGSVIIQ